MAATTAGASKRAVRRRSNGDAGLLQRREAELAAMAARQAATLEILKTISASPDDPQPVFDLIARRARELCGADQASVSEYDGELVHLRATEGYTSSFPSIYPRAPDHGNVHGRLVLEGAVIHIRDLAAEPDGYYREIAQRLGAKSLLGVPLLREGRVIGGSVLRRTETGGFDDAQVALVQAFAEQAVIAIASAQTRRELAARNSAFGEQIDHQAATIDVLKAMSASPSDPQPVFDLIVRRARDLCNGDGCRLFEFDGKLIHLRSSHGAFDATEVAYRAQFPKILEGDLPSSRSIRGREIVHIRNTDAELDPRRPIRSHFKSQIAIPLLHDGKAIGTVTLGALKLGGFSDTQVELLKTFAEQAVIAISSAETYRALQERTRDLSESLAQQTAMADVLQVINSSPGDLAPVFDAILEKAIGVCDAEVGVLLTYDGEYFSPVAFRGVAKNFPWEPRYRSHPETGAGRLARGEEIVHILDSASGTPVEGGSWRSRLSRIRLLDQRLAV
jgi:GAF domain-containing protein